MLIKGNELNRKAYMLSAPAAAALTSLHSGQMVTLNASGEVILCAGTTRGFMAFSDKNATKDNVTDHGNIVSYAIGPVVVTMDTNSFVTGETYAFGTRLKSTNAGKLTPMVEGTDSDKLVCAIALGAEASGTLRVAQL